MLQRYIGAGSGSAKLAGGQSTKCASLLRKTTGSMVSDLYSKIDTDFIIYRRKTPDAFYAGRKNNFHQKIPAEHSP